MNLAHYLKQGLQALSIDLPETTQNLLLNYVNLLARWNRSYNLTAIHEPVPMLSKHVLDSLTILPYVQGTHLLDVGTGAGLPGLLLAIACPQWYCVLLDSNAKKTRFVQQALIELNIQNAKVVNERIETFQSDDLFHTIVSRAYTDLYHFYCHTERLCATEGQVLAMKGVYPTQEIADLAKLPIRVKAIPLQVPQLQAQRHLVVMRALT